MRYARTNYGITTMLPNKCILDTIIKESNNIIDLIEPGDYVNGYRITGLDISLCGNTIRLFTAEWEIDIFEEDIKSIVTKEQFESMEYKVGE